MESPETVHPPTAARKRNALIQNRIVCRRTAGHGKAGGGTLKRKSEPWGLIRKLKCTRQGLSPPPHSAFPYPRDSASGKRVLSDFSSSSPYHSFPLFCLGKPCGNSADMSPVDTDSLTQNHDKNRHSFKEKKGKYTRNVFFSDFYVEYASLWDSLTKKHFKPHFLPYQGNSLRKQEYDSV